jgi:hypothetical protein
MLVLDYNLLFMFFSFAGDLFSLGAVLDYFPGVEWSGVGGE